MRKDQNESGTWLDDGGMKIAVDEVTDLLDAIFLNGPNERDSKRAVRKVAHSLRKQAGETLYYDVLSSTPVGPVYIAMSDKGVTALGFDDSERAFIRRMGERHGLRIERSSSQIEQVARQLKDYFAGKRDRFEIPLDLRSLTPFQRSVLHAIQQVPAGTTVSYGGLARRIGKPNAARAVGQALGRNPIPIIIPCHRALAADGSLGGYSGRGGVRTKQALLSLEGAWG